LANKADQLFNEVVQPAVEKVRSSVNQGASKIKAGLDAASDRLTIGQDQLLSKADDVVCANPYAAVGIAALAGLALGVYLARR
jgi:ElaB/YqjD/DUF883 family membrane-anchored ribosome-binding protein